MGAGKSQSSRAATELRRAFGVRRPSSVAVLRRVDIPPLSKARECRALKRSAQFGCGSAALRLSRLCGYFCNSLKVAFAEGLPFEIAAFKKLDSFHDAALHADVVDAQVPHALELLREHGHDRQG
jgi:hypothetical protein